VRYCPSTLSTVSTIAWVCASTSMFTMPPGPLLPSTVTLQAGEGDRRVLAGSARGCARPVQHTAHTVQASELLHPHQRAWPGAPPCCVAEP
jgi:hypothetical protein